MIFRKLNNLDIRPKLMLVAMSITCVSTLLILITFLVSAYDVAQSNLQGRLEIQSQILGENISAAVIFKDDESAKEILSSFAIDPAVLEISIFDVSGKQVFHYEIDDKKEGGGQFSIRREIIFGADSIGELLIIASKNEVVERQKLVVRIGLIIFFIAMCVAYVLSFVFQRAISSPIMNLHGVSQKVAKTSDYSLRAKVYYEDEIGRLAVLFNQMLEQVEHRDAMLEKQVSQRTFELEKLAEEFKFRAFHDNLTGLPNRALMNERFDLCVEHARRHKNQFVFLLLDLDNFKTINDTKGHDYGDDLLREIAKRLKKTVRSEDLVCRLGGDEFVVILVDIESDCAAPDVAKKILSVVSEEVNVKGEGLMTGVSIGGAVFPDHGEDLITLKRNADVAMYRAKDLGKNQYCQFAPDMQEEVKYRLMIQNDLRTGLIDNQIKLYFQPKILPNESRVSGCETLVRWDHPKEGLMLPYKFIPYAEEVGLVQELDYYVIENACRSLRSWKDRFEYPISLALNLSGRHFRDFTIVRIIKENLERFGVDPSLLEIEITEAVLISDPEMAQKIVHGVKDLGVSISLDDFGTGYSSLDYLRTLPIDSIKIDQSFVKNIHLSRQDQRITRGIISLAKGLGLGVVAEGVETKNQEEVLLSLGCYCMQGYYYLRPAPEERFIAWTQEFNSLKRDV